METREMAFSIYQRAGKDFLTCEEMASTISSLQSVRDQPSKAYFVMESSSATLLTRS